MKKYFVGGYYDDRIFEGNEFEEKTPYGKDIDIYTLEQVKELGFVNSFKDDIEELDEEKQIEFIMNLASNDDRAGLEAFDSIEEAQAYKKAVIEEVEEIESKTVKAGWKQNKEGIIQHVYKLK